MNKYGLIVKFKTHQDTRDAFISILLQAARSVQNLKGCHQYTIAKDVANEDIVIVSEIWDTKEEHDNSLKMEGSKEFIAQAMPLLNGRPETTTLEIIDGNKANQ